MMTPKQKKGFVIAGIAIALILVIGLVIIFHSNTPPANTGKPDEGNSTKPKPGAGSTSPSQPTNPKNPTTQPAKIPGAYAKADNTPIYNASPFGVYGHANKDEWIDTVADEWDNGPLYWKLVSGKLVNKSMVYLVA